MGGLWRDQNDYVCHFAGCGRQRIDGDDCGTHAKQRRRGVALYPISKVGRPAVRPPDRPQRRSHGAAPGEAVCATTDCDRKQRTMGLCSKCYARERYRALNPPVTQPWKGCPVAGCDGRFTRVAGIALCERHRAQGIKYGLDAAGIVALWARPECAICGAGDSLHIDHDHACCDRAGSCGACVRGLLCQPCNQMIGFASDRPERLLAAVAYLDAFASRPLRLVA